MDIFKLVGSVFVDTDEANKSLSKTGENAEKTGSKFSKVAGAAGKAALGIAAGAAAVGTAMIASAKDTAKNLDVIDKASQRMKIGAESYQELAHAANLSGVEMSTLEKAAKKLEGTDLNLDDAMAQIYELGTAEERSAKAAELFGEAVAYQMTPMLNASGEEMAAMRQEANDLGLVMSEDSVKAGAAMNDAFSKVQDSIGALTNQIGVVVMPIVQALLDWVINHMPEIQTAVNKVTEFIKAAILVVVEVVKKIEPVVKVVFEQIKKFWETILKPAFDAIAPTVIELFKAIEAFWNNTMKPVILSIVQFIIPLIKELFTQIGVLWSTVLKPIFDAIIKLLQGDFKGAFSSVFTAVTNLAKMCFNGLIAIVKTPLNTIIGIVNKFIGGLNLLKIPDWIPEIGGKGVNIPLIPYLANGGEINAGGLAVVGEAGAELVEMPRGARVTPLNDNNNAFSRMESELSQLHNDLVALTNAIANHNPVIKLDTGALVGQIANPMNNALGMIALKGARGIV